MSRAETEAHARLKRLAVVWAQQQGYTAVGIEVRLPKSAYRVDVTGWQPGATAVWECKQARADFLKDSYAADKVGDRLKQLDVRRQKLEELLKVHFPSLRKGESLFDEFDAVNLTGLEHDTYNRVVREMEVLQRRLFGKTKFDKLRRYLCANLNYLVVEPGILAAHEVPAGWGLLMRHENELILERKPVWQETAEADRLRLLQRIAVAGTRGLNRALGIPTEEAPSQ